MRVDLLALAGVEAAAVLLGQMVKIGLDVLPDKDTAAAPRPRAHRRSGVAAASRAAHGAHLTFPILLNL